MPDRAKIISKIANNKSAFPKGGALGAISEKEAEMKRAGKSMSSGDISPKLILPTMSDREMELESLLSAEEEDNYDRIDKQGMSDEFDKDVVDIAKAIYRKGKKVALEFAGGLKEGVKTSVKGIAGGAKDLIVDDAIEKAGKDTASGMSEKLMGGENKK